MNLEVSYDRVEPVHPVTLTFDLNNDYYLFVAWGKTYTGKVVYLREEDGDREGERRCGESG